MMSQTEGEEAFEYCDVTINSQEKASDVYTQLEKLGEGKFGMVYRLQEKATGKIRAGKYFRTRMPKERQAARAEVELMNLLHHPRLVQCLAAFQSPEELVMVMEYIAGGELFERIVDDDFEHTEPSSIQYVRQILEGLQYMHSQAIVHLDLKPENIVCVSPSSHWLKIIDFGLARKLAPDNPVKVLHGTPEFMAPEVVSFEPVGFTTDMWSIGVICYILLSGESPFQGENDMETLSNITAAQWEFEEETFSEISQQAKDFISQLLQKDARCRLSSKEALLHSWLQQPAPSSTKVLSKERIKQFLTRRKWQKTGKALLALNRLTLRSQNLDRKALDTQDEEDLCCSLEEDQAFALLPQQGPSFSKPLTDQEAAEGGSICLQCRIEGVPALEVTWLQDCTPLKDSPRVRIKCGPDGCCSLTILELTPKDAGRYVCRAVTATGKVETSAVVAVLPQQGDRQGLLQSQES
ncbi:myosin light chain kinase, smooth muscle isoform X2 [Struthio camelus]|uniref:myosin light chain kinase, smooth muscle isoform X2 n=1 Tax=Struthio camelus TaxID=8801 RepID=UPI003603DCF1